MAKGQKVRVEQEEYQTIARDVAVVFEKQGKRLANISSFLTRSDDYSPVILQEIQTFLNQIKETCQVASAMSETIRKRGITALDDQKKELLQGTLKVVRRTAE